MFDPLRIARASLFATFALCAVGALSAEEMTTPTADTLLSEVLSVGAEAILDRVGQMRTEQTAIEAEATRLHDAADRVEAERQAITAMLKSLEMIARAAMPSSTSGDMIAAALVPPNFVDHFLPIVEQRCRRCHRDDRREGGLSLVTFAQAMDGGGSGQVISPGDPDGSRLMRMVLKTEEPYMPPKGKSLTEEQLDSIRVWIEAGALQDGDSKMRVAKRVEPEPPREIFIATEIREGPPPMPEGPLATVAPIRPRGNPARAVAASPTAPLAAVGSAGQIVLFDLDDSTLIGALPFPEGEVHALTFSVNGELLLAAGGNAGAKAAAVLWEVRTGKRLGTYGRGYDTILAADISPDHRMIALGGPDRKVHVYDATNGDELYTLNKHTDWVYSVKFTPDGELLASADRAGNLFFWQAANGRFVESGRGHTGAIHDLAYTYDSNVLASAGHDGRVFLWDTWKYTKIRNFRAHPSEVLSLDFNKDNQLVTSGRDGLTRTWGLDGKNLGTFESLEDWVYRARYGKSGTVILGGNWAGHIAVWDTLSREKIGELTTNPSPPQADSIAVATALEGS